MTASIVPVWSMTSSRVMGGEEGSSPRSFSATTTWAELDTGSNSAKPCTIARIMTFSSDIGRFSHSADRFLVSVRVVKILQRILSLPDLRSTQERYADIAADDQACPILIQMKFAAVDGAGIGVENVAAGVFAVL